MLQNVFTNFAGEGFCLQTIIPNEFGGSMRCCYRDDHSLIEGYAGSWTSSFIERHHFTTGEFFDIDQFFNFLGNFFLPCL